MLCLSNSCASCASDAQCRLRNPQDECYSDQLAGHNVCRHRTLLPSMDTSDFWMMLLTFLIMFFAAPVGIGGGPILVPMFLAIGHFSPQGAIPLSPATIFGGALANNLLNIHRKHPTQDKALIDYDVCAIMAPSLLLSTVFGVFFNAVSPRWLITLLLVGLFLHISYLTSLKTYKLYQAESDGERCESQRLLPPTGAPSSILAPPLPSSLPPSLDAKPPAQHPQAAHLLAEILEEERGSHVRGVGAVILAWAIVCATSLIKGGRTHPGIVPCASTMYWVVVLLPVPIILAITWYIAEELRVRYETKTRLGHLSAPGDIHWSRATCRTFVLCATLGGFAAGSLGIAAGLILGPVLLEMGVLPMVSVATTGFMVLFIASSTTVQFLVLGQIQLDYALVFAGVSFLGGGAGNLSLNRLVKEYRKTWIIVAFLAATILACTLLTGVTGFQRTVRDLQHGADMGLRPLCQ